MTGFNHVFRKVKAPNTWKNIGIRTISLGNCRAVAGFVGFKSMEMNVATAPTQPASPRSVALRAKRKRERLGNGDWESGRTTGVFTYLVNIYIYIYFTGSPSWPKWNIHGWFNGDLP